MPKERQQHASQKQHEGENQAYMRLYLNITQPNKRHALMIKQLLLPLALIAAASSTQAATFAINTATGIIAPTTRGSANTTYFGWDTFGSDGGGPASNINDITPDIGTNPGGVRIQTMNGEDHTPFGPPSGGGNIYTFTGTANENVTVTTNGVFGTGFTTIIAQAVTANFGNPTYFSGIPVFTAINGVSPTIINGLNANGFEQLLVRWDVPGNQSNYTFNFTGSDMHYSNDKFVVDTFWDANGFQPDIFGVPEPGRATLLAAGLLSLVMRRRRAAHEVRA
jgi:hypothetical protein